MAETASAVFSAQNLRFRMVQRNGHIDLSVVLHRSAVHFEMCLNRTGRHNRSPDADWNLGLLGGLLEELAAFLHFFRIELARSINDDLRSVRSIQPQCPNVIRLTFGQ